jgi:hypothetical protein
VVDHVRIFPNSTAGWVRVTGQGNFERAFRELCPQCHICETHASFHTEMLNGGEFEGRCLIAKGENAHEPIYVRDLQLPSDSMGSGAAPPSCPSPFSPHPCATFSPQTPVFTTPVPRYIVTSQPAPSTPYASLTLGFDRSYSTVGSTTHSDATNARDFPSCFHLTNNMSSGMCLPRRQHIGR